MEKIANRLEEIVADSVAAFHAIGEESAGRRPSLDDWSAKEVIGHLIDSAANNHHRFVRVQIGDVPPAASYEQAGWVRSNHYYGRSWNDLVELWSAYNRHLAHVVRHADPATLERRLPIHDGQEVTLKFVMEDYVTHMEHHVEQIRERTRSASA